MSFPPYEKARISMCGAANDPSCKRPAVVLGGTFGDTPGIIVYQKGRLPVDGSDIHRWLYLKDGQYAGSTDWYASAEDAAEECRVAMRKKAQDKGFDSIMTQTGVFWLMAPDPAHDAPQKTSDMKNAKQTRCAACGNDTTPETAISFELDGTAATLCRDCMKDLWRNLTAMDPDRAPGAGQANGRVQAETPEPDDGAFLRVCGGTAERLREAAAGAGPERKAQSGKLGHLDAPDGLTEFVIPVLCTGTKLVRVRAATYAQAVRDVEQEIKDDNAFSSDSLKDFRAKALAPELMLAPEDRASWPYWGYGWYGTDGVNWRSYRTDKGPKSIPDTAEESWPIPAYGENQERN